MYGAAWINAAAPSTALLRAASSVRSTRSHFSRKPPDGRDRPSNRTARRSTSALRRIAPPMNPDPPVIAMERMPQRSCALRRRPVHARRSRGLCTSWSWPNQRPCREGMRSATPVSRCLELEVVSRHHVQIDYQAKWFRKFDEPVEYTVEECQIVFLDPRGARDTIDSCSEQDHAGHMVDGVI